MRVLSNDRQRTERRATPIPADHCTADRTAKKTRTHGRDLRPDDRFPGFHQRPSFGGGAMIVVNLDVMLAKRKMRSRELAGRIGITDANLPFLKSGKLKRARCGTLDAICAASKGWALVKAWKAIIRA